MLLKVSVIFIAVIVENYAAGPNLFSCNSNKLGIAHCLRHNNPVKWSTLMTSFQQLADSFLNKNIGELYKILRNSNITADCRDSLSLAFMALRNFEEWAFEMVDASGKIPSGILDGTVMDLGSYDRCLKIRAKKSSNGKEAFRGRFCMVGYKSRLLSPMFGNTSKGETYFNAYGDPPKWIGDAIIKAGPYLKRVAFWFGTCIPSTCSGDDIRKVSAYVAEPFGFNVSVAGCDIEELFIWPISAIISVCILCIIFSLCTLGTLLDVINRYVPGILESYYLFQILKAFSLPSNAEILLKTSRSGGTLSCFHGIRFFSASWIILGHTYFFTDAWKYLRYRNLMAINEKFNGYLPAAVLENFTIPVASFFFMSGFLLVFSTLKKLEKNGGMLNVFAFTIHKYWRMTPALGLMITMLFTLPLLNSGPLWNSTLNPPINACQANWWTNVLYINNFWDCEHYCLIHTWYLATLMQCQITGVLLMMLSFRWPRIGTFLGFIIGICCSSLTALLVVWYDFPIPAPATMRDIDMFVEYTSKIYSKFFCHMPSYLIGMAVAYLILKYKDIKIKMKYVALGWILAVVGAVSSVYGLYGASGNVKVVALYIAGHRICWTLSIGWLAFACITGYGGIVNRILSWNVFIPLGHLSYLAYLLHPLIMLFKNASLRERIYYGHTEHVFEFLSYTVISFFLAFIGHVAVETPFLLLEGMVFKRQPSVVLQKTQETKDSSVLTCSLKKN